jgi:hypothetical protein
MTENVEVFENEEANKFLDYFVGYMKLMSKIDNIKSKATQNNQASLIIEQPTEPNIIDDLNEPQPITAYPIALEK